MTTETIRPKLPSVRPVQGPAVLVLGLAAVAAAAGLALATTAVGTGIVIGGALVGAVALWMAVHDDYHLSLAVLLVWLGVFDGYVRLKTGKETLTIVRDVFVFAIAAGWLVRNSVRKESVRIPPLGGWALVFVGLVLVQLFNPADGTLRHSVAALRPHLEWVPLFFLGYAALRSIHRLRAFAVILVCIGALNGVVGYKQFGLTTEQLASWGPGYQARVFGTGDVSARLFPDSHGNLRPRPFALGSDSGFGGTLAVLALPFVLALVATARGSPRQLWVAIPAMVGCAVALLTSQSRTAVVACVVALLAFLLLAVRGRRFMSVVLPLAVASVIGLGVVSAVVGQAGAGGLRYQSIAPSKVFHSTVRDRGTSLALVPGYVTDYPLGAGIGSVGPAARIVSGLGHKELDGETEFTFLLVELGLPGLLLVLGMTLRLIVLAFRRVRKIEDDELRWYLAAVAAPFCAFVVSWFTTSTSVTSPNAPYFWFAAGVLAYWLLDRRETEGRTAPAAR